MWADEPYYTLDTSVASNKTTNNAYEGVGTVTVSEIGWSFKGNGSQQPWRLGGKSLSNVNREAFTTTAMGAEIGRIDLTVGSATDITVNSLTLIVASDAAFNNIIESVVKPFAANSTITFEPSNVDSWAENSYYKFVFNVSVNSGSNKFVQFSKVEFYEATGGGGSELEDCDIALEDDPVELEFDLYNNASAQVINYTTSSTGAVTIADSEYATFAIDEENKTITVTPTAVTPDVVTITVNQAADDTYNAGSTTFDLLIEDTTPIPTHTATFSVNGATSTEAFEEGADIEFPEDPANVNGKTFVGWVTEAIDGTTNDAPEFVTSATMGQSDITYYAVFAYVNGSSNNESLSLTASTENIPSSYGTANAFTEYTFGGVKFQVMQMYKNGGKLQWRAEGNSNGTGTLYNNESLGKINSIVLTYNSSDNNKNFTLKIGNKANPTTGESITPSVNNLVYTFDCSSYNCGFFVLANGSNAGYLDDITINYALGSSTITDYCTTVAADSKQDAELSFAVAEVNANISEQYEAPTLNAAEGFNGTVEYTSSDESVAQIMDMETGDLMLLKEGTTTITATFAGNDDFRPGSASYTLTVTDNRIATTIIQENIVLDASEVASLTQLNPVVKDANDNVIPYEFSEFLSIVSFEQVSEDDVIASLDGNLGQISLSGNVGTATLKAYYNRFNDNSTYKPSECTFTITVESTQTIAEARAQGTGTVTTKGIVTSCSGTTAYIQDATAAICVYGSALTVGDEVKVSGTLSTYSGLLEITNPTVTVLSQGNTVTPEVMTIADINASANQGWLVKIENVTVTDISSKNVTIKQDDNTIVVRFNNTSDITCAVNDVITLIGNIGCYNSAAQIANPTDVTVVELEPNTITVKQRYYYNGEYHYNVIPTDPEYQIDIVNFEHITFVVEANGATATAESADNTILEINALEEANTFEAVGTGGSWEGQEVTVTFTTPSTSTYEAAERTITFLVKRPAAPTFSLASGTYGETQYVTLSTLTGSSNYGFGDEYEPEIWYVTSDDDYDFENNDEPDQIVGHQYDGTPIEISKTTTIKAWTYRYDLNWSEAATATYIIDATPSVDVAETAIDAEAAGTEGTIEVTYNNMPQDEFVAEVVYYDAEGNDASYDWFYACINDETNNIDYVISENTSTEARTAYIKVYAIYDDEYFSDIISFTQAGAPITYTLASELISGKTYVIASGTSGEVKVMAGQNSNNRATVDGSVVGTTLSTTDAPAEVIVYGPDASGYYTMYDAAKGYLYAASSGSNYLKSQSTNDKNGKWSISIDGDTNEAEVEAQGTNTRNILHFNPNNGSPVYSCYGSNSSINNPVYFFEKPGDPIVTTKSVTLNDYGYATFASNTGLDFLDADDASFSAWQITGIDGTTITFEQINEHVTAGTGILLKGTANATINLNILPGGKLLESNMLEGFTYASAIDADAYYGLSGNKFKKVGAGTVKAGKALLPATVVESSVKTLNLMFNEADGITRVETITLDNDAWYDLTGRRVAQPTKGLFIHNGKKVMIK